MNKQIIYSLILFFIFFLLWLWSYKGISIDTTIILEEDKFEVYFDDYLLATGNVPGQDVSRINVNLNSQDLETDYLKKDVYADFYTFYLSPEDHKIQFTLHNPFKVVLEFEGGTSYKVDIGIYRYLCVMLVDPDGVVKHSSLNTPTVGIFKAIKWILWIILKPFPYLCIIFSLLYISFIFRPVLKNRVEKIRGKRSSYFLAVPFLISALSVLWSRYLMSNYSLKVPHVPDAISYVMIGKMIASGRLRVLYSEIPSFIPQDKIPEYFDHWFTPYNGTLIVKYLTGHPLLLAAGELTIGMSWIPPIVGGLVLFAIFFIAFKVTNSYVFSSIAMIICFVSPFFQSQTVDYMSHNSAALYLIISIIPVFFYNPRLYIITGFFQGMLLNTRPLTFLLTIVVIALYEIVVCLYDREYKKFLWKLLYGTSGILLPSILFLYYNYITTGNIFTTPYIYHPLVLEKILGGNHFNMECGLIQGFSNIKMFAFYFLRNYYITFGPLILSIFLLPFCYPYRRKIVFLLIMIFGVILSSSFYDGNFFMYGPRFIYESVPLFALLYGITFYMLFKITPAKWVKVVFFAVLVFYFSNLFIFELQWMGKRDGEFRTYYVPANIRELRNFNWGEGRFYYGLYKEKKGKEEIFLMEKSFFWWYTGEGIWLNSFPLNESKPIFLVKPDDYDGEVPEAKIIKWEDFPRVVE